MTETDVAEVTEAQEPQPTGLEVVARQLGWKPETEWKGDKPGEGLLSAEDYIVRQYRKNDREARELKREVAGLNEALSGLSELQQKAYDRAKRDLEAQRSRAAENGDNEAHMRTNEQLRELEAERKAAEERNQQQPQVDPELKTWLTHNDWYESPVSDLDIDRAAEADRIAGTVARATGLKGTVLFDEIKKRVFAKFPDTNTQRRRQPAAVEGGGRRAGGGGKSWDDLPDDEKAVAEKTLKLMPPVVDKETGRKRQMTKAEFAAQYFARNGG